MELGDSNSTKKQTSTCKLGLEMASWVMFIDVSVLGNSTQLVVAACCESVSWTRSTDRPPS